jgi:hypothetical protein
MGVRPKITLSNGFATGRCPQKRRPADTSGPKKPGGERIRRACQAAFRIPARFPKEPPATLPIPRTLQAPIRAVTLSPDRKSRRHLLEK